MAHVRFEYAFEIDEERQIVVVQVLAGPAPRAIRPVGRLELHPSELNAMDRLLGRGAIFESPANTYAIARSERPIEPDEQEQGLRGHIVRQLVKARR